ncbi:MAG: anthranilate phosphoribosyltransferase [Chromatiales bacterium]|jgi:anthranilate phosphoribosyltransferase|nr:anthranilate phosphoribosyltransferase [Chromatiales bacterium]
MTQPALEFSDPHALMHSIIQRIATGPELSKNISREEARGGMSAILDGMVDPVQAAIFLIALRMKRETDAENLGILNALLDATQTATAAVDVLVDIADPYDGYNRTLPAAPFLPAVLAACGVPAVSHGVESMGPKFGVTHRQVLRAAGLPVDLTPAQAAARIENPDIGWAYVDQQAFCPKLHALTALRTLIIKRPVLTTIETGLGPIRARGRTHLMTGFVHKGYPRIYALLARAAGFDSALIVRGVEGGVIPSLRQSGRVFQCLAEDEPHEHPLQASDFGVGETTRPASMPGAATDAETAPLATACAAAAAEAGLAALNGAQGPARDALICAGATCLWHLGRFDTLHAAADAVRIALDSGRARKHLNGA